MLSELSNSWVWEHVNELRKRLLYALLGLLAAVIGSFFFTERLIAFLAKPIGGLQKLQAIEVTENVSIYMKTSLLSGVIIALPWIIFQLLKFILPGLTAKEKKWIFLSIPAATILFISGVGFAYLVMLEPALKVMTEFLGITTTLRVKSYMDFVTNLLFWIGVSFEFPLIIFVLARLGIVNSKMLGKGWRIAIVIIAILAAIITPTVDPVNMLIFMLPLFLLYLLSILLAAIAGKHKKEIVNEGDKT